MRISKIAFLLLLTFSASAFGRNGNPSDAIRQVLSDQVKSWNTGNLKAFMNGYWNSPDVTFASRGSIMRGWSTVYHRYVKTYGGNRSGMGTLAFSDLTVVPLSDSAAFVYGRWKLEFADKKPVGGVFSLVFRKFSNGWKIVHDHTSRG